MELWLPSKPFRLTPTPATSVSLCPLVSILLCPLHRYSPHQIFACLAQLLLYLRYHVVHNHYILKQRFFKFSRQVTSSTSASFPWFPEVRCSPSICVMASCKPVSPSLQSGHIEVSSFRASFAKAHCVRHFGASPRVSNTQNQLCSPSSRAFSAMDTTFITPARQFLFCFFFFD